jgi:hypothetical protein
MSDLHQKIFHGARGIVKLQDREIGHVTDVNLNNNFENIVFAECGSPISPAIVNVGYGVDISVGYSKLITEDPVGNAMLPKSEAEAMQGWPEMEMELVDSITDDPICRIVGCMPQSVGMNFGARTLCGVNQRWQARYIVWASEE